MGASGQRKRSAQTVPEGAQRRSTVIRRRVRRESVVDGQGRPSRRDPSSREGVALIMMGSVFTPKGFLTWGGAALLLLGIVGYLGIFSQANTPAFWLDGG